MVAFSTSDASIIGHPYAETMNLCPTSSHCKKINSKWVISLNVEAKTTRLIEEKCGVYLNGILFNLKNKHAYDMGEPGGHHTE